MFWKSEKEDRRDMETAANLVEIIDGLSERRTLLRFLAVCLVGNIVIWIITIVFADLVYAAMSRVISDKLGVVVLGIPWGLGMLATYCLFRLKLPTIEDNKHLQSDLMASFTYQSESTRRWFVWLFSVLGGVVNALLLVVVNMYFADAL